MTLNSVSRSFNVTATDRSDHPHVALQEEKSVPFGREVRISQEIRAHIGKLGISDELAEVCLVCENGII